MSIFSGFYQTMYESADPRGISLFPPFEQVNMLTLLSFPERKNHMVICNVYDDDNNTIIFSHMPFLCPHACVVYCSSFCHGFLDEPICLFLVKILLSLIPHDVFFIIFSFIQNPWFPAV